MRYRTRIWYDARLEFQLIMLELRRADIVGTGCSNNFVRPDKIDFNFTRFNLIYARETRTVRR